MAVKISELPAGSALDGTELVPLVQSDGGSPEVLTTIYAEAQEIADLASGVTRDASTVTYTPAVVSDWDGNADPGNADDAFDQLAERVKDIEGAANPTESLIIACSDETTALTAGTAKVTFRMPYPFTLSAVRASVSTAQATGSTLTVDVNEGGSSILSTKLTIDNTEKTSTTAATPAVISDASLADDAEITIDIDTVGDGTAKGLKVVLIGART